MGVYINMEMPKSCEECKIEREILEDDILFGDYDGFCPIANEFTDEVRNSGRLHRCPLGDVPIPHGKLIDANTKLSWEMYDDKYQEWYIKSMTIADALDNYTDEGCPPAIIEAE